MLLHHVSTFALTPSEAIAMLCFNYTVGFPLSAPVLSWLFTAQGKPESVPSPAILAMCKSTIHQRRQVASAQLERAGSPSQATSFVDIAATGVV